MVAKKCSKCQKVLPVEEFYKYAKSKDGLTHHCQHCYRKYRKEKQEHYRQYMENRRKTDNEHVKQIKNKSWQNLDPRKKMLQQAKNRCNRKNLEFNLELKDIILPPVCPLLEIPFVVGTRDNYEHTYSLDRINSSKGYIKGNVWVITKLANSMKNSASKEELVVFAKNIFKYFKDDDIVRTVQKYTEI